VTSGERSEPFHCWRPPGASRSFFPTFFWLSGSHRAEGPRKPEGGKSGGGRAGLL